MSQSRGTKRRNPDQLPSRNKIIKSAIVPGPGGSSSSMHDASSLSTVSAGTKTPSGSANIAKTSTTGDNVHDCPVCKQTTLSTSVEITSLKCCLCNTNYHGDCLSIDESLMNFLYVIVDIGGWCCVRCRKANKNSMKDPINPVTPPAYPGQYQSDVDGIKKDLEMIKLNISKISYSIAKPSINNCIPLDSSGTSSAPKSNKNYANVVVRGNQTSNSTGPETSLRASVLETFHTELHAINQRSSNVVVSGLHPRSDVSDDCLFQDLCATHLCIYPTNITVKRLGVVKPGKVQPLLVQMSTPGEASSLLSHAKLLRNSSDPHVKEHVYFNKHMTRAEAANAYNLRCQRRLKLKDQSSASPVTNVSDSESQTASGSGKDCLAPECANGSQSGSASE